MDNLIVYLILLVIATQLIQTTILLRQTFKQPEDVQHYNDLYMKYSYPLQEEPEEPTGDLGHEKEQSEAEQLQNFISEINKAWNGKDDE